MTLPNSDERKGIGTNTTDVRLSVLGSHSRGRVRVTADLGVGILEAPLETFEQNDVIVYSGELLVRASRKLRLALGVEGRASTRSRVPIGTEDLGELRSGLELSTGRLVLDVDVGIGYAGTSADWSGRVGVAVRAG